MTSRYWMCTGLDENGDELSFVIEYQDAIDLENGELYSLCLVKGLCYCLTFTAIENCKSCGNMPVADTSIIRDIIECDKISKLNGMIVPSNQTDNFNLPVKSDVCKSIHNDYILIRSYCNSYLELKIPYDSRVEQVATLQINHIYDFTFGNPEIDGMYIVVDFGFAEEEQLINEIKKPTNITPVDEEQIEMCENHKFVRCDGGIDIISTDVNFGVDAEDNPIQPIVGKHYRINWMDCEGNKSTICVEYAGLVNETAIIDIVYSADDPAIPFDDCGCNSTSQTLEFVDCVTGEHYYWPQSWFLSASDFTPGVSYTIGIYLRKCYTYIGPSNHEPNNPYPMNKASERLCVDCDTYYRLYDVYSCYSKEKFDIPVIISGRILTELEALNGNSFTFEYDGVEYNCITYGNYVQLDAEEYEEFMSGEHILIDDTITAYKDCKECIDGMIDTGEYGVWTITSCDGETNILVLGTADYESYDGCTVLFSVDGKFPKCGTINRVDVTDNISGYDNVNVSRIDIEGSYKDCQKCHDDNCNEEEEKNEVLGFTPDNDYSVNATYDSCIKYDVCCEDKNKDL